MASAGGAKAALLFSALRQRIIATVGTIESRPTTTKVTIFAQKNTLTS
jgi:hypothetical protein